MLVLLVLVVSMLAGCLGGGKSYRLTVQVLGVGEEPLEGASVVVGAVTKDTDADGKAVFEKVSGKVTIEVEAADYIAQSKSVTVSKDQIETIALVQDTGDVEDLMDALQDEEFEFLRMLDDGDSGFFDELNNALGYFADSILVSIEQDSFVNEVELVTLDLGQSLYLSKTLSKSILLDYEEGMATDEYLDELTEVLGFERAILFEILLTSVDFFWGDLLGELVDEVAWDLQDPEYKELIADVEFDQLEVRPPVIIIKGDTATWMQVYTIPSTVTAVDDQILTSEYSVVVEFGLVRGSAWAINEVHVKLGTDETLPKGIGLHMF